MIKEKNNLKNSLFDAIDKEKIIKIDSLFMISREMNHKDSTAERTLRRLSQAKKIKPIYNIRKQIIAYESKN